ncbi:MAG: hypothetical protein LHW64_09535 [Candidatus Cloacimonetes bacterium]|nr:hypothetical protein [Candidatus Cloacimonadota bacterium]MDY0230355.1 hypothetical protein [Candidatus Cloacimonadaceae bacterium]
MIKIGNRELVESYSLLIPEDEKAVVQVDISGWKFEMEIAFDNSPKEKQGVNIVPNEKGAKITFVKWDNGVGTALVKPGLIAKLADGRELVFMASNYSIGGTNKFDIQLLLEGGSPL